MKRFFTFTVCILSLTFARAASLPPGTSSTPINTDPPGTGKNTKDTIVPVTAAPLPAYLSVFKQRLDSIQKEVPLDYNEFVQNYIDIYTRHKDEMSHVLGLAKYYFPIYEKAFKEAGIPQEIKYLSIVESKLDPMAVSRVGATGPWQFMPATAKLYGLAMDGFVDDRRDPVKASYAAAAYLKDAYMEFGDWLLAIASYNCGKSNVERAIAKAGALDFWSIRQYLPKETRGYVPAYIAISYVMNYADKHSIFPVTWATGLKTDTVLVDRLVALANVSKALSVDVVELGLLNPAYKKQVINGTVAAPRRMVIPQGSPDTYAALYDVLNSDQPLPADAPAVAKVTDQPQFHKIKRGETLAAIADRYNVEVQDLKDWNNLRSNKATPGKKLWLNDSHMTDVEPAHATSKYITYKVKRGDTLNLIAEKFDGTTPGQIRSLNGLKHGALQPGMTLKITKG